MANKSSQAQTENNSVQKKDQSSPLEHNPFLSASSQPNPFLGSAKPNPFAGVQKKASPFQAIQRVGGSNASRLSGTADPTSYRSISLGSTPDEIEKKKKKMATESSFEGAESVAETVDEVVGTLGDSDDSYGTEYLGEGVGEAFGIANGLFTMGMGIKTMLDPDEDSFDRVMAGFDVASGAGGIVESIGSLVQGEDSEIAEITGIVSSSLGAIKSAINVIKKIKDLKDGVEEGNKAQAALELASEIAQLGLDIANTVKGIYEAIGDKVPGALEQAIPGLGIVMAALGIIQQGIELAHSVKNYRAMSGFKDELKVGMMANHSDAFTSEKSGVFRHFRSENRTVDSKIDALADGTSEDSMDAGEYRLARELKKVNRKRIIRQAALIGADALTIGGEIATLTGVGSGVGVGLKIGSAGVKGGMKIGRILKQKYRDSGYGNQNKTSQKKQELRSKNIKHIFRMIKAMTTLTDPAKQNALADKIKIYVEASGANFKDFVKYKASPEQALKLLNSAMKKREAGDEVSAE